MKQIPHRCWTNNSPPVWAQILSKFDYLLKEVITMHLVAHTDREREHWRGWQSRFECFRKTVIKTGGLQLNSSVCSCREQFCGNDTANNNINQPTQQCTTCRWWWDSVVVNPSATFSITKQKWSVELVFLLVPGGCRVQIMSKSHLMNLELKDIRLIFCPGCEEACSYLQVQLCLEKNKDLHVFNVCFICSLWFFTLSKQKK